MRLLNSTNSSRHLKRTNCAYSSSRAATAHHQLIESSKCHELTKAPKYHRTMYIRHRAQQLHIKKSTSALNTTKSTSVAVCCSLESKRDLLWRGSWYYLLTKGFVILSFEYHEINEASQIHKLCKFVVFFMRCNSFSRTQQMGGIWANRASSKATRLFRMV